ncbi:hypothetical protein PHET_04430 [Paragonimus heterotremus]|uniref:Uncharacterized protein n=1 Tax=Paragonimus heterotremus TaxID=100268 RepID=A0A8J4WSW8_9TREM|nr:hypothetical protein PHET_04430 [Paragonimus heterotremus]
MAFVSSSSQLHPIIILCQRFQFLGSFLLHVLRSHWLFLPRTTARVFIHL